MNENIDLTKILKDCPKGWKFFTPICGEVEFSFIKEFLEYSINMSFEKCTITFSKEGFYFTECEGAECLIFPSKEQRDWSKFEAPWYKKDKKDKLVEPKFKVGDKIVNGFIKYMGASGAEGTISKIIDDKYIFTDGSYMFINNQDSWNLVFDEKPKFDPKTLQPFDRVLAKDYLHGRWTCGLFSHIVIFDNTYMYNIGEVLYKICIPYNEDTKHLVGTIDEAPEYYRYWED